MMNVSCLTSCLTAIILIQTSLSFQTCRDYTHVTRNGVTNRNERSDDILPFYSTTERTEVTAAEPSSTTTIGSEENPRLSGLSFMLDDGTRKSHSIAQNTAFVTGFFSGLSTRESFKKLVTSLYFIYTGMEGSFDTTTDTNVRRMDDLELRRVSSMEKDMDYFYGPGGWKDQNGVVLVSPSPSTMAYVSRIKEISSQSPHLLIAHQYTRYLGDLFGGQMMGGMATRSLNLEEGKGVSFYEFDDISNVREYITGWYRRLNELDLTDREKREIVDEANYVFTLNIAIFDELEGSPLKAVLTLAFSTFKQNMKIWHETIGDTHNG